MCSCRSIGVLFLYRFILSNLKYFTHSLKPVAFQLLVVTNFNKTFSDYFVILLFSVRNFAIAYPCESSEDLRTHKHFGWERNIIFSRWFCKLLTLDLYTKYVFRCKLSRWLSKLFARVFFFSIRKTDCTSGISCSVVRTTNTSIQESLMAFIILFWVSLDISRWNPMESFNPSSNSSNNNMIFDQIEVEFW